MSTENIKTLKDIIEKVNIELLSTIIKEAGKIILEVYNKDFDVEYKEDTSPLTEADKRSNEYIVKALKENYPEIPILAEESKSIPYEDRKDWKYFWLIDPLDGTKEFVKRNGEFTINIALIEDRKPILGLVYFPVLDILYYASEGNGSYKIEQDNKPQLIKSRKLTNKDMLVVIGSRSHACQDFYDFVDERKKEYKEVQLISAGSALKFCLVAEGKADIYPRLGGSMEWDTAAGHIIVNESGKKVYKFNSDIELTYNKPDLLNDWFICK